MNRSFKIIGRHPETKRQMKKTVYTSEADYLKYRVDIIRRWGGSWMSLDIEEHELVDSKWVILDNDNEQAS